LLKSEELKLAIGVSITIAGACSGALLERLTKGVVDKIVDNATELADAARSDIESGKIIKQD